VEITWFGQSCFLLKSKDIRIVTDPYSPEIGLKLPKDLKAHIVTVSHEHFDHNFVEAVHLIPFAQSLQQGLGARREIFIIREPGEYEIHNIEIIGVSAFHDNQRGNLRGGNIIFLFHLEDLGVCHLGDLGHTLSDEELERLNQVDILLVPVGGNYTIDAKKAVEVINQIDPKVVIPMHYKIDGLASSVQLDSVDKFLKEIGGGEVVQQSFKISKGELPADERRVVILEKKA